MKSHTHLTRAESESARASLPTAATNSAPTSTQPSDQAAAESRLLRDELQTSHLELEAKQRELRELRQQFASLRAHYRALLDATPDLMFRISRDGTYLDFRAERHSDLLLPPYAIIGTKVQDAPLPPEVKEQSMRLIGLALDTGQVQSFDYSLLMPDGRRYYECRIVRSGEDEILCLVRDVTQRQRTEEALRESEDRYRDLVESSQDLLSIHDLEGRILSLNQGAASRLGYEPREVVNKNLRDILAPEVHGQLDHYLATIKRDGVAEGLMRVRTKAGEHRIWEYRNTLRTQGVASPVVRCMAHDVTERKRAENALRLAEEKYRAIFENAIEGIAQSTPDGPFITVNPALARMLGYDSPQDLLARIHSIPQQLYVEPERRAEFKRLIEAHGLVKDFECELYRKDGSRVWVSMNARVIRDPHRRVLYYEGSTEDITARKRAEEQLREQAALLDHARDAIMVRDLSGQIIFWNKSAERIYGWTAPEVLGRNVRELLYKGTTTRFESAHQQLLAEGEWSGEMRHLTKDGKERIVESHWTLVRDEMHREEDGSPRGEDRGGEPKSVLVINTDITEKKKIEAQFLRVQRLESIGTLAGGIAHDLNNVFAPILMAIKLLNTKLTDEKSRQLLSILQSNTERGAQMVKQVVSFARGAQGEQITLSPKHLIKEMVKILGETLPKSIQIKYAVPEDLWYVMGDATQIHQVLMNLCVNARDAMPNGGQLTIAAENMQLDEITARAHLDAKPGPYVRLTVADTGDGIPAQVIDQIFEPFFTTKEAGVGTGLGLSTVLSLVRGHSGFITVASSPGEGTNFQVYLPAVGAAQAVPGAAEEVAAPLGQGETILVVDDEAAFRQVAREILEASGYRVLTASDGVEAVALYAQYSGSIQVVLADLMMPSMSSISIIRTLREIDPRARIIASSGLVGSNNPAEVMEAGAKAFLPKPYTADQLLKTLAKVLNVEEPERKRVARKGRK